jgi:hypothetical protein
MIRRPYTTAWLAAAWVAVTAVPAWGAIFTDILGLPAQRAIERLAARGIFRMTPDGKFHPSQAVSRADFAVLISRALGLSGQGVPLPAFADAADIPPDARAAVAAVTNLGTVSPPRAEVRKGTVVYTLSTDKTLYGPAENIELRFTITNTGRENVTFPYATSQLYDFIVTDARGVEVARWSLGRAFLGLYLASGLAGALFSLATPFAAVVGASGAVFGVLLGFAMFWPHEPILLWAIVPIPARVLVIVMAVLSLASGLSGSGDGVAHFAHLGGFAGGWLYLKWHARREWRRVERAGRPTAMQRYAAELRLDTSRWESIRREELHEINRAEVDRILAKMRTSGAASLTPDERAFMDRMAAR